MSIWARRTKILKDDIVIRYVPTPADIVDAMCELGKIGPEDIIYEPGCGDGRMVVTAVSKFKAKRGLGLDLDPKRVEESKETAKKAGVEDKIEFRLGDILKVDDKEVGQASVVLLYLGNEMDLAIRPQLLRALKPGLADRFAPLHHGRLETDQDHHDEGQGRRRLRDPLVGGGEEKKEKEKDKE